VKVIFRGNKYRYGLVGSVSFIGIAVHRHRNY